MDSDWVLISQKIHKWTKTQRNDTKIPLQTSKQIIDFIANMQWYADQYLYLINLEENYYPDFKHAAYNFRRKVSYQKIFVLGLISPDEDTIKTTVKIKLLTEFLSIRAALSGWNRQKYNNEGNAASYILSLLRRLRANNAESDIDYLVWFLIEELKRKQAKDDFVISENILSYNDKTILQGILAVLLDNLPSSRDEENYLTYVGYSIEHLLAKNYAVNDNLAFETEEDYLKQRDRLGALALLPSKVNSSLQAEKYTAKLDTYSRQNLSVALLSPLVYDESSKPFRLKNNPSFNQFLDRHPNIKVKPYKIFNVGAIQEREQFYASVAQTVWDSKNLEKYMMYFTLDELKSEYGEILKYDPPEEQKERFDVIQKQRERINIMKPGTLLISSHKKWNLTSTIEATVVENMEVIITKLINAPRRNKFSTSALELSKKWEKFYTDLLDNATLKKGDFYSWEGRIGPLPHNIALLLLNGTYIKTTTSWKERKNDETIF